MIAIIEDRRPLVEVIAEDAPRLDDLLLDAGAVLFRGFGVSDQESLVRARRLLFTDTTVYREKATPRRDLGDDVFTSTEFPAALEIRLHNENSYARSWPAKLLFACFQPPASGGATTVADCRAVLAGITDEVVTEFRARGWRLVRNYHGGFGLPWQEAFGTTDPDVVEAYCAASGLRPEWHDGVLRTEQTGTATIRHPVTGEEVWFNHVAFWHESSLDPDARELMIEEFGPDGLPYNMFYGDGGAIPDDAVADIARSYAECTEPVRWQRGDLLLVENMLCAHGREPYGGTRQVVVALGDAVDARAVTGVTA